LIFLCFWQNFLRPRLQGLTLRGLCTSVPFVASYRSGVLRGCWLESRRNSKELALLRTLHFSTIRGFTSVRCPQRMLVGVTKKFQGTLFYSFCNLDAIFCQSRLRPLVGRDCWCVSGQSVCVCVSSCEWRVLRSARGRAIVVMGDASFSAS
jgi:hypothetical protein